jgi:hypothetical protein
VNTTPKLITETNLSVAWAKAFLAASKSGRRGLAPLVLTLRSLQGVMPSEDETIRKLLDDTLSDLRESSELEKQKLKLRGVETVSNTIFRQTAWVRTHDPQKLFAGYKKILPRLRQRPANRNGLYFGRMIHWGPEGFNQLEHIIQTYQPGKPSGNRRPTALVAGIFDPTKDHSDSRQRGFPCLHHVMFTPLGMGKLAVNAVYPCQYLFDRGYGNYLGLCRLGLFIAHQLKLHLDQFTCFVGLGMRCNPKIPKALLKNLCKGLRARLRELKGESHSQNTQPCQ